MSKSVLPIIKKKYSVILILLLILALMLPEYIAMDMLFSLYLVVGILLAGTFGLQQEWNFKKINKRLRPFVVTRQFQYLAFALLAAILIVTVPDVIADGELLIPYSVLWVIALALPFQYTAIFTAAHTYKKKDPTRCEFC